MSKKADVSIYTEYLTDAFTYQKRQNFLRRAKKELADVKYDGFVVCGVSGLLLGTLTAHYLRKGLVVLRKDLNTHSTHKWEGNCLKRYVFLDDFVSSGKTYKMVRDTFYQWECVGAIFYEPGRQNVAGRFYPVNDTFLRNLYP